MKIVDEWKFHIPIYKSSHKQKTTHRVIIPAKIHLFH